MWSNSSQFNAGNGECHRFVHFSQSLWSLCPHRLICQRKSRAVHVHPSAVFVLCASTPPLLTALKVNFTLSHTRSPRPAIVGRHITSGSPPNFDVHWLLASIHLKYLFVAHPAYLLLCRALLLFAITVTHRSSSGTANCG